MLLSAFSPNERNHFLKEEWVGLIMFSLKLSAKEIRIRFNMGFFLFVFLLFFFFLQKDRANKLISFPGSWSSSWHFHYTKLTYFSIPKKLRKHMCYRLHAIAPLLWLSHKTFYVIDDELSYKSFSSVQNILRISNGLFVLSGAGWIHCTSLFFHQVPSCFCRSVSLPAWFDGQPVNWSQAITY